MRDHPAAEGMEVWFAVDAAGHLALFSSGAMPKGCPLAEPAAASGLSGTHGDAISELLVSGAVTLSYALLSLSENEHISPDFIVDLPDPRPWWRRLLRLSEDLRQIDGGCFFFVREPIEVPAGAATKVLSLPAVTGAVLYVENPTHRWMQELHSASICRGCCFLTPFEYYDCLEQLGVFAYESAPGDEQILEACQRIATPAAPLIFESLPVEVRSALDATRLSATRFARDEVVQPLDEAGDGIGCRQALGWRSADGHAIRPFSGKEKALEEYLGQRSPASG